MRRRMVVRRALVPAVVVVAAAALLGACGSGDDDAPASPDYATAADATCARYDAQLGALPAPADREQASVLLDKVASLDEARIADLRELEPPAGAGARAARLLQAQGQALSAVRKAASALRAGDKEEYAGHVDDATEAAADVQTRARALKLAACARYRSRVRSAYARLPLPSPPPTTTTTTVAAAPAPSDRDTVTTQRPPAERPPDDTAVEA